MEAKEAFATGKKAALPLKQDTACLTLHVEDVGEARTQILPPGPPEEMAPSAYTLVCTRQKLILDSDLQSCEQTSGCYF